MPDGTASRQGGTIPTARWSSFSVQLVLLKRYIHPPHININKKKIIIANLQFFFNFNKIGANKKNIIKAKIYHVGPLNGENVNPKTRSLKLLIEICLTITKKQSSILFQIIKGIPRETNLLIIFVFIFSLSAFLKNRKPEFIKKNPKATGAHKLNSLCA